MRSLQLFNVTPRVPENLRFLETLSRNVWWAWDSEAFGLFRRIDPQLWKEVRFNPLEFLGRIPQGRLTELASDEGFADHVDEIRQRFEEEVLGDCPLPVDGSNMRCIAYFSLEYGIAPSVRIYSGGLGILAGDHLKTASDMGLPLIAVGLLYRQGYFQQYLNNDGWQQESYPEIDIHHTPITKVYTNNGQERTITIQLPEGPLHAAVWRLDVGHVPLYLLDTNIHSNPAPLRQITGQLYGGDRKMRIRQELLLGVGGFKTLTELGYVPAVCHMNEGHAAFLSLARMAWLMKTLGIDKEAAEEVVTRTNVFTTHTPVPAGNEAFPIDLVRSHLEAMQSETGLTPEQAISRGTSPDANPQNELSMTILGLRLSQYRNGVSKLHGVIERNMWQHLWKHHQEDEIPISHVTNGVHLATWLSNDHIALYDRYLGYEWRKNPSSDDVVEKIARIPDDELWRIHENARNSLIRNVRMLLEKQYGARNETLADIIKSRSVLDHHALTIGFARRFATYKRATLLLRQPDRLEALLRNDDHPVQFIFAGKAHPADNSGKALIQQIVQFAQRTNLRKHIVFLEDYDMFIAKYMAGGVDAWINTPRRPQEASGTSGMKVAANGGINVSVLDGWWDEGYTGDNGWAIGHGETYEDQEYQDAIESQALYNILENEMIPSFYERPADDIPVKWIAMMKASIQTVFSKFTSLRMLHQYHNMFYEPALESYIGLTADKGAMATRLVEHRKRLADLWSNVRIKRPVLEKDISFVHVGDKFMARSTVSLGKLKPEEVDVQVYYGPVDSYNKIQRSFIQNMKMDEQKNDSFVFSTEITCELPGRYGLTTRVVPSGDIWKHLIPGFITWADE